MDDLISLLVAFADVSDAIITGAATLIGAGIALLATWLVERRRLKVEDQAEIDRRLRDFLQAIAAVEVCANQLIRNRAAFVFKITEPFPPLTEPQKWKAEFDYQLEADFVIAEIDRWEANLRALALLIGDDKLSRLLDTLIDEISKLIAEKDSITMKQWICRIKEPDENIQLHVGNLLHTKLKPVWTDETNKRVKA